MSISRAFMIGCALTTVSVLSQAQTKIKDSSVSGTSSLANPGAILDLESNKRALLLPRVALANTTLWEPLNGIAPTQGGYTVYNINTSIAEGSANYPVLSGGVGEYYWDGSGWVAKKYNAAAAYQEPFQVESTTTKATSNSQNIYQNGNLGLGDFSTASPIARLDVRGAVRGGQPHDSESDGTSAVGLNSVAFGSANIVSGNYSGAIGYQNSASGVSSIAMGSFSIASGNIGSIALGDHATASGQFSTAIGHETSATEYSSTALGHGASAGKDGATAIGLSSSASGNTSLAIGSSAEAIGALSTAMGNSSDAIGESSLSIGNNTVSDGDFSVAIGTNAKAAGRLSTAMGYRVNASSSNETVIGFENAIVTGNQTVLEPTDALLQVGNGFSSGSPSNALTILKNAHTAVGVTGTEGAAKPTELLDLGGAAQAGQGGLKIRNINSAAYTGDPATDKLVVADASGVLKTISATLTAASYITTKAADYTLSATDETVLVNASAAGVTITLPTGAVAGKKYTIKKIDTTVNTLTLNGGGGSIDGNSSVLTSVPYQGWVVQFDGSNWFIISKI